MKCLIASALQNCMTKWTVWWLPHLISVLVEAHRPEGVHTIISLSFMFSEGLHHILNPPKLFLDADVLLAGRLRLGVHRKRTRVRKSHNIICKLTLNLALWTGEEEEQKSKRHICALMSSALKKRMSRLPVGPLTALLWISIASDSGSTRNDCSHCLCTSPAMEDKIKGRLN